MDTLLCPVYINLVMLHFQKMNEILANETLHNKVPQKFMGEPVRFSVAFNIFFA